MKKQFQISFIALFLAFAANFNSIFAQSTAPTAEDKRAHVAGAAQAKAAIDDAIAQAQRMNNATGRKAEGILKSLKRLANKIDSLGIDMTNAQYNQTTTELKNLCSKVDKLADDGGTAGATGGGTSDKAGCMKGCDGAYPGWGGGKGWNRFWCKVGCIGVKGPAGTGIGG